MQHSPKCRVRLLAPYILDTYTTERHPVAARPLQNTRAQIALMRPDPQTRALWEMFSDLMDLDDARRYVADMLAGMDVRYDLGDDHRFVGTLCPDMKLTLERPGPDVVTAVTRSADLLREGRGLLLDLVDRAEAATPRPRGPEGSTPSPPHGPGGRRRAAHPAPRLSRPGLAYRAGPRRHHAGACAGHMVRPTGLSTVLTVASGSLGRK
ncbi:hypothetical protein ACFY3G_45145 [Streptomyces phaeochromogenes]|uniref:hypothetical protein n=1 Tax=Streptomyces phaeochromogenes TaxID=1923 RepID=UPI0036BC8F97